MEELTCIQIMHFVHGKPPKLQRENIFDKDTNTAIQIELGSTIFRDLMEKKRLMVICFLDKNENYLKIIPRRLFVIYQQDIFATKKHFFLLANKKWFTVTKFRYL